MNTSTRQPTIESMITLLLLWTASTQAAIRYVAPDGSGASGLSWATAYTDVQTAVNDPDLVAGDEIRIKQGRFTITKAIRVNKALKILGGYSGVDSARDPHLFETIIDGGGKAWHGFAITADAVVDGLTITGANAFDLEGDGGGMYIANCKATVTNCVFLKNSCRGSGGGIALVGTHGTVVADCTFTRNTAELAGGGIYSLNGNPTLNGCLFTGNKAGTETQGYGGGIMNDGGSPSVIGCTFTGNLAPYGAGLCNTNTSAYTESCTFADSDSASIGGGGVCNIGGAPTISRCLFRGNTVNHWGGAILDKSSSATISNCIMWNNVAMVFGGAVYMGIDQAPPATRPRLINCTMYGNTATRGGALFSAGATTTLWNCILWGNQAYTTDPGLCNYPMVWPGTAEAFYCDIQGDSVYPGGSNLAADPLFENPAQGDFHLRFGSPCIDAGSGVANMESVDFEGSPRLVDGEANGSKGVDLGALEFQGRGETGRVYAGKIMHAVAYDGPGDTSATYIFKMLLETDDTVSSVEFRTPTGSTAHLIPNDARTSSGNVSTSHSVRSGRHEWQYKAEFDTLAALAGYGNGVYRIICHYKGASQHEIQTRFLVPGTSTPIAQPTQRPIITSPQAGGAVGSPVTVAWSACTDPFVNTVFTQVTNTATGEDVFDSAFAPSVVASNPYPLKEGQYKVTCSFADVQETVGSDGTPFTLSKAIQVDQQIQVPYTAVYRFWSPTINEHFYTINEEEKDRLIRDFSQAWTFEGVVYHACSTPCHGGLLPVYRFWSGMSHLYTIDETEKDRLLDEHPDIWSFESIAFYVYPEETMASGCVPVHQLWNAVSNTYFYTAFEWERERVLREFPHVFTYEGIAFYAYP